MTRSRFPLFKAVRYRLEAWIIRILLKIFGLLPLETASRLGKLLGQTIGPYHKASRIAQQNMRMIFPHYSEEKRQQIVRDMWGNLGRIGMEYTKIKTFLKPEERGRIRIQGQEILEKLRQDHQPAIFFGAHLGHWQMITLAARLEGVEIMQISRAANNPWFNQVMQDVQADTTGGVITKGHRGGREMIAALQKGKRILAFVDQKMNDGISVPFLGYPAMTASGVARLAQKFQCPFIPVRVERLDGPSFQVTFYEPLSLEGTEGDVMKRVNDLLSEWIVARPEQWFWVHNRWPSADTKGNTP